MGDVDGGWRVAMGTLAFERGASTLGQNLMFLNEWDEVLAAAQRNGRIADATRATAAGRHVDPPAAHAAQRHADHGVHPRGAAGRHGHQALLGHLHRDLGELAMDVLGAEATLRTGEGGDYSRLQRLFLFSRADTIYAGTNEIQRNLIGERALGLPKEPS